MAERKQYVHISFDKAVAKWIQPLVESKALGYESITEFIVQAVREKLDYYLQVGLHPWSVNRRSLASPKTKHGFEGVSGLALLVLGILGILAFASGLTHVNAFVVSSAAGAMDFYAFYNHYWFFIDFLIYLTIFVSVAYVTIGRMFGHRGIAIGIGLFLAVAMASFEAAAGFAISDLGMIAATFLLIILTSTLYHIFRALHFGIFGSASVTLLLIYLAMIVMIPPVFLRLRQTFPFVDIIIFGIFAAGLFYVLKHFLKERHGPLQIGHIEPVPPAPPELQAYYPELKEEQRVIQTYLAKITTRAKKDCKTIVTELTYIYHILTKFGDTPESRKVIAKKLKAMIPQEQDLDIIIKELQQRIQKMQRLDYNILGVHKSLIRKLKPAERKSAEKEIKEELGKVKAEEQLSSFHNQAQANKDALLTQVNDAVKSLNQGDVGKSKQALLEAIKNANAAADILDEMKTFEEVLNQVITKELAALRPRT